jgi:hypothetical protein
MLRKGLGEEDMEENLIVVPNPSSASSTADAKKLGAMMPAKPGEKDPISTNEADATTNVPRLPVAKNTTNYAMRDEWMSKYGKTHNADGSPKAPGMMPSDDQSAAEIGRLSNVAGMNAAGKPVPRLPVLPNSSNYAMRDEWMSKYGKTHNADGSPKSMATNEADMEEGNAFSGAVAKAKADGIQPGEKITVGGKEYDLKESDDDLNQIRRIAGLQECGMSPISGMASDMQDDQGIMNISTKQSSDGTKSVTISAEGDAASSLMQMLKLAGMSGDHVQQQEEPAGVMVVAQDDGEEVDEAKDERYHASTTPDEQVSPVQAQTKGGNGDVAGQEKKMKPGGYQFGDNNHAMQELSLIHI